ncbi:hypothetical protein ABW20_dc0108883 [Dactylellina cionopaga]|nr:hypothetical protein ABW20_dc0108883 [Dactylellina cionopaga]
MLKSNDVATSINLDKPYAITNKVAAITDTQFTRRHLPLIMHFHAVLGPEWPIVFFTTQEVFDKHLKPNAENGSAIWTRALQDGRVQTRIIPEGKFDLESRNGVNAYLSDRWMWEQLAPADHVLVFQTDAIICANSHKTMDDFLEWDFIGATLSPVKRLFNGGLSLRNRNIVMDILNDGADWQAEFNEKKFKNGEDHWFSEKIAQRGGKLPDNSTALEFSCEYNFHLKEPRQPLGYHKVHKNAPLKLEEIAEWCPEIALAAPGNLE